MKQLILQALLSGITLTQGLLAQPARPTRPDTTQLRLYVEHATKHIGQRPDSAYVWIQKAQPLAARFPHHTQTHELLVLTARYWIEKEAYQQAGRTLQTLIDRVKPQSPYAQTALYYQARIAYKTGMYQSAIDKLNMLEARLLQTTRQPDMLYRTYVSLGGIYIYLRDTARATANLHKSLPYCQTKADSLYYYYTLQFQQPANSEKNLTYGLKALKLAKEVGDAHLQSVLQNNIADYYLSTKQYALTARYVQQAIEVAHSHGLSNDLGLAYGTQGQLYIATGQFAKAVEALGKTIQLSTGEGNKRRLVTTYADLSEAYQGLGQHKAAYDALSKSLEIKKAIAGGEVDKMVKQIHASYHLNEKAQELRTKTFQSRLQQSLIQTNRKQNIRLTAMLVILAALIGWLVFTYRRQRKLRIALATEKGKLEQQAADLKHINRIKNRIFKTLGQDLRSPVNEVQELMGVWKDPAIPQAQKDELVKTLYFQVLHLRTILENLLYWGKKQVDSLGSIRREVSLQSVLMGLRQHFAEIIAYNAIQLQLPQTDYIIQTDEAQLQTILHNLFANLLKFTPPGGYIYLQAQPGSGRVVLTMRHTHTGTDMSALTSAYRSLYASPETTIEEEVDLNLYVSYQLAAQLGIKLSLNTDFTEGITAELAIPLAPGS